MRGNLARIPSGNERERRSKNACHPERSGEARAESKELHLPWVLVRSRVECRDEGSIERPTIPTRDITMSVKIHHRAPRENPLILEASTASMIVSTAPQTSRKASNPRSAANDVLCKLLEIKATKLGDSAAIVRSAVGKPPLLGLHCPRHVISALIITFSCLGPQDDKQVVRRSRWLRFCRASSCIWTDRSPGWHDFPALSISRAVSPAASEH